jgi:hypothetical protein
MQTSSPLCNCHACSHVVCCACSCRYHRACQCVRSRSVLALSCPPYLTTDALPPTSTTTCSHFSDEITFTFALHDIDCICIAQQLHLNTTVIYRHSSQVGVISQLNNLGLTTPLPIPSNVSFPLLPSTFSTYILFAFRPTTRMPYPTSNSVLQQRGFFYKINNGVPRPHCELPFLCHFELGNANHNILFLHLC